MPFRYRAGYKKGDDLNPIIFLDNSLEDVIYVHIHEVQDQQGNWGRRFEICVKETDNCPLCAAAEGGNKTVGRSVYAMVLSVLDLRPYTDKHGHEVTHSRKMFMVKGLQVPDWIKVLEKAEKRFKTLRGVYMEVGRSSEKDAGTGKPLPLEKDWYGDDADDKPYALIDEADLLAEYGHDAVMSQNNKILKQADEDTMPYDYGALFTFPDLPALSRQYGLKSRNAGSQADLDADDWEKEDDRPARRGRADRSSRHVEEDDEPPARGARRSRRAEVEEEEDDIPVFAAKQEDDDDAPAPPSRTRKREAPKEEEAPTRRRRSAAPVDEEDEVVPPRKRTKAVEEDDAPKRTSKRAAPVEEEEEDEDVAPRTRTRQSVRSRSTTPASKTTKGKVVHDDDEDAF